MTAARPDAVMEQFLKRCTSAYVLSHVGMMTDALEAYTTLVQIIGMNMAVMKMGPQPPSVVLVTLDQHTVKWAQVLVVLLSAERQLAEADRNELEQLRRTYGGLPVPTRG